MAAAKAMAALNNTELTLFSQRSDLIYDWIHNAKGSWLERAEPGQSDRDILGDANAIRMTALKEEVLRSGKATRFELSVVAGAVIRWFDIRVDVERAADGATIGLVGTSLEITDQKRREETLKTLLRELSHRSKNLLAIIQSLASQTARHSVTVPEFLVRFRGRIQSLSSSQDIVTDADWRGADLINLVRMQVERYAPDGMEQVRFDGPDVYLSPTASLHVGLAFHELAVNAASYGSLSVPGGRVTITSALEEDEGERVLRLEWQESGGPQVRSDHDPRFGTSTLERIVPNSVGGEARLTYRRDGVHYRLMVPESQFEEFEP
ncbi:histidine kinase [Aureimonas endophytica]|uniref:histidine kinase n=1 Tax=Aureimonas endophytica TaxID=2027858 RepID=A0A916ZYT2_9HYPH|nr:PAS domain-containing sensor histidine kinase [Aureimonas endophytica]GGE19580.1 histidine kinase [Aureimonas endophytica]